MYYSVPCWLLHILISVFASVCLFREDDPWIWSLRWEPPYFQLIRQGEIRKYKPTRSPVQTTQKYSYRGIVNHKVSQCSWQVDIWPKKAYFGVGWTECDTQRYQEKGAERWRSRKKGMETGNETNTNDKRVSESPETKRTTPTANTKSSTDRQIEYENDGNKRHWKIDSQRLRLAWWDFQYLKKGYSVRLEKRTPPVPCHTSWTNIETEPLVSMLTDIHNYPLDLHTTSHHPHTQTASLALRYAKIA